MKRRLLPLLLAVVLLVVPVRAAADSQTTVRALQTPSPGYGDEWQVLAVCLSGNGDASYAADYFRAVSQAVQSAQGVLDSRKSTETSRAILAVTAAGYDARQVGGYDLTALLADGDFVARQGINGIIFALLALDSGNYPCAQRSQYVQQLLDRQLADGGWALSGETGDVDMTAMALQALAPYQAQASVAKAVAAGLDRLSALQKASGGFASYGVENCESCAQVILALCQLGLSVDDPRFVTSGHTVLDALQAFRLADGSYAHQAGGESAGLATTQAALALVSLARREAGDSGVYTMSATFDDLAGHWAAGTVQDAVHRGLFGSADGASFRPEAAMTRREVATALWRAAGSPTVSQQTLSQVPESWRTETAMVWAWSEGILTGVSADDLAPEGTLTRAQAVTLLWRMAGEPAAPAASAGGHGLTGSGEVPAWADTALGWAIQTGLIQGINGALSPNTSLTRAQAAALLLRYYNNEEATV